MKSVSFPTLPQCWGMHKENKKNNGRSVLIRFNSEVLADNQQQHHHQLDYRYMAETIKGQQQQHMSYSNDFEAADMMVTKWGESARADWLTN